MKAAQSETWSSVKNELKHCVNANCSSSCHCTAQWLLVPILLFSDLGLQNFIAETGKMRLTLFCISDLSTVLWNIFNSKIHGFAVNLWLMWTLTANLINLRYQSWMHWFFLFLFFFCFLLYNETYWVFIATVKHKNNVWKRTVHTGGHGPGGARYLSRETGTFDCLRSFLNLVLVAAAMGGDHLTRACLHVHWETRRDTETGYGHGLASILIVLTSTSAYK